MSRNLLVGCAVLALSGTLGVLAAQKADPARPAEAKQPGARRAAGPAAPGAAPQNQWTNTDHALASCVASGNQVEVALGQFASEKSENEAVKSFAAMLVQDHKKFLEKLTQFAPEASMDGYLMPFDAKEARANDTKPAGQARIEKGRQPVVVDDAANPPRVKVTAGFRPGDAANQAFPHALIERELAQQCLMSARETLDAKSGPEFDKCFIGHQIAMHMHMKDKLVVFQRHASGELGQLLAAGQKKTEEHLAKAEELMKTLDHGSAEAPRVRKNRDDDKTTTEKPPVKE